MKSKSQRYNINRPRPRHGDKYDKNKICLSIMMVICIQAQFMRLRWKKALLIKKTCLAEVKLYLEPWLINGIMTLARRKDKIYKTFSRAEDYQLKQKLRKEF